MCQRVCCITFYVSGYVRDGVSYWMCQKRCVKVEMIKDALPVPNKTTTRPNDNTLVTPDYTQENSVLPDVVIDVQRQFVDIDSIHYDPPLQLLEVEGACFQYHCHQHRQSLHRLRDIVELWPRPLLAPEDKGNIIGQEKG